MSDALTTAQAAGELGYSHQHVKALCLRYNLGRVLGKTRVLSRDDLETIRSTPRPLGRPRTKDSSGRA